MSRLPASVRESIEAAAELHGLGSGVLSASPVGGGCIHHGTRLSFADGGEAFVKWSPSTPPGMFEAEAAGLAALREVARRAEAGVHVPEVIAHDRTSEGAWLMLEYVPRGATTTATSERLGRGLARLHGAARGPTAPDRPGGAPEPPFGWSEDNWIGALPQSNRGCHTWSDFWASERIEPQLARARASGYCGQDVFDRLVDVIPDALSERTEASLLHGDLWSGNVFPSEHGRPVLIDPAVYRGDAEVDLAMTELFGGFGRDFYEAYADVHPIPEGYHSHRRDLYQLYYLLVHVNLFGGSYEAGSVAAARRVVDALG